MCISSDFCLNEDRILNFELNLNLHTTFFLKQFLVTYFLLELEWPHCEWRWCLRIYIFGAIWLWAIFPWWNLFSRHIVRRAVGAGWGGGCRVEGVLTPLALFFAVNAIWVLRENYAYHINMCLPDFLDLPTALRPVFVPSSSFLPVPA